MENGYLRCENTKETLVLAERVAAMEGARVIVQCARKPGNAASAPVRELEEEILIARVRTVRICVQKNVGQPFNRLVILTVDVGTYFFYGVMDYLVWNPENPNEATVFFVAKDRTPYAPPLTVTFVQL